MNQFVKQVVETFKTNPIRANQEEWGIIEVDGKFAPVDVYCCGLGALLIGHECYFDGENLDDDMERAARLILGLPNSYVSGFLLGFDRGYDSCNGWESHVTSCRITSDVPDRLQWDLGRADGETSWIQLVHQNLAYQAE